jgi:hypothetical protein
MERRSGARSVSLLGRACVFSEDIRGAPLLTWRHENPVSPWRAPNPAISKKELSRVDYSSLA